MPVDLDVEQDNLRAAWTWGLQHDPELALRISAALWRHWLARGSFTDGRHRLEAVLAAAPDPTPLRARALLALAAFDVRRGSGERLQQLGTDAVAIHRADHRDGGLAQALHAAAALDYMCGDWDLSWLRAEESREAALVAGDDQVAVAALHLQALVLMGRDDTVAAVAALDDVRARLRALPHSPRPFFAPLMLGFAVEGAGTPSPRVFFEETVLLGRQVPAELAEGYLLCNLADMHRSAGDLGSALTLLDEAACRFASAGSADGEALALNRLGCLHRVRFEYAAARDAFERSLQLRTALGDRRGIGLTLANLGVLFAAEGDLARGLSRLNEALAGFELTQDKPGRVGLAITLSSVLADAGEYDEAAEQLLTHLPTWDSIPGNHRATAWTLAMLADVERRRGRDDAADRAAATAHERLHALGVVHVLPNTVPAEQSLELQRRR
jgi:tetratricopeptide (TPR) repeat protein